MLLIGRLTKDPELRYTPSGKAVCGFRLAVDWGSRNPESGEKATDFIDIVCWDKQAENVAQYVTKGRLVAVDGRLQMRQYEAQDGSKRTAAEVVARTVKFLESKKSQGEGSGRDIPGGTEDDEVPF